MGDVLFYGAFGVLLLGFTVVFAAIYAARSYRKMKVGTPRERKQATSEFGCMSTILAVIAVIVLAIIGLSIADCAV